MTLVPDQLCLQFCEDLLRKSVIAEKILSYNVELVRDSNEIDLKVYTEEDEYKFKITLTQNRHDAFLGNSDMIMALKDVSIMGYNFAVLENIDVMHLKSILRSLASIHSKSIEEGYFKTVIGQAGHSLRTEEYLKLRNILYGFTERSNMKNIDIELFRRGVENLSERSKELLRPTEEIIYVKSNILQHKLFFKRTGKEEVQCKIIKFIPDKHLPLVYDMLLTIFLYSNQNLRQCYFHELVDYCYRTLDYYLHGRLSTILPVEEYEMQIKSFIPFVKLEVVYRYCRDVSKQLEVSSDENTGSLLDFLTARGNLPWISLLELFECFKYPTLIREDCYKAIRNKIGSTDYNFLSWSMTPLEERPGFLGDYHKLKINMQQNDEEKTVNLFVKCLPTTSQILVEIAGASFNKEKFFYDTFIRELTDLGLQEIIDFAPRCYFSRSNDVLIFEDLAMLNYRSFEKTDSLSYETVRVVIKQVAKLHACSLLYEEMMTKKSGKTVRLDQVYKTYMKEINLQIEEVNSSTKITIVGIHAILNYILDTFPDIPKEMTMETFKEKVRKAFDIFFKKVQSSDKYRNVICQGDFWGSNILFKNNEDGLPVDCCIIDYQLIRYCPPTHDLFFLIYVNCDKETRDNYMNQFIEDYYSELSTIVGKCNVDLNQIYTYEQFLDCCDYMKSAAICLACLYLQFIMVPAKKAVQDMSHEKLTHICVVDRKELIDENIHQDGPYRQRFREIIQDLYEICLNDSM